MYNCDIRLVRDGMPVDPELTRFSTIDTRSLKLAQLQQIPFQNYASHATSGRPAPLHGSWGDQVDLESSMRPLNRELKGGEPRTITLPLSWFPFVDLVCGKQQPEYRDPPMNDRMTHKSVLQSPKCFGA
jgi:hypothetical protein